MRINSLLFVLLIWSAGHLYAQSMSGLHPADMLSSESHEQAIRYPSLRQVLVALARSAQVD